ncbi:alpha-galactosidase [Paraburkholderia sp.]|uniref:alpha-galactosidase n=1 Tax=Paraburkholderia sp. TaxID=1926495 RepID=UPI002F3FE210
MNYAAIKAQADGLATLNAKIASGARYEYVNIDEGWWASGERDPRGDFVIDEKQWPGGMPAIARYIHGKGLKAGIYIDSGPQGCGQRANGSHYVGSDYAHYDHDFLQFARWGFDFVKVDFCGGLHAGYDPQDAYRRIAQSIQNAGLHTGQYLTFSICDAGYRPPDASFPDRNEGPWTWGAGVGAMWRTTDDIYGPGSGAPDFRRVTGNLKGNYHPQSQHTGYYNDPDMMVAGMGMSAENDRAHMSLWAISGAPLILGNDLSKPLADSTVRLLTNVEIIAIDQDGLGVQGLLVNEAAGRQVWAKLLTGTGRRAVALFNNTANAAPMSVTWQQLGLAVSSQARVRDVWAHEDLGRFAGAFTAQAVPAGGVVMLEIQGVDLAAQDWVEAPSTETNGAPCPSCVKVAFNAAVANEGGAFIQIAYINAGNLTGKMHFSMNGAQATTVALPPTRANGGAGTVVVYAWLQAGQNSLAITGEGNSNPVPVIRGITTVAGPVAQPGFDASHKAS